MEASTSFDSILATALDSPDKRDEMLADWAAHKYARNCHPREEHLIPLHVCAGAAAKDKGKHQYHGELMGARMSNFIFK